MDFSGKKIFRLFGDDSKAVYSDGFRRCVVYCPEINPEDLLPLYFILMTHTTAHLPLSHDEKTFCFLISEYCGIDIAKANEKLKTELYPLYGQVEFSCAAKLLRYSHSVRKLILRVILLSIPAEIERSEHIESVIREAGAQLELSNQELDEIFLRDDSRRRTKKLMISSGLGLILALVVLLLFVVSAVWLKTVFFGLICAYLCLPLTGFFEKRVIDTTFGRSLFHILSLPFVPAVKIRNFLLNRFRKSGIPSKTEAEQQQQESRNLALKSATLTLITVIILLSFLLFGIFYGVRHAAEYINCQTAVRQTAEKVDGWFLMAEKSLDWENRDSGGQSLKQTLQGEVREVLDEFHLSSLVMGKQDESAGLLSAVSGLGTFVFDLLMFFFFFFFFLFQMSLFRVARRKDGEVTHTPDDIAVWVIHKMTDSPWIPEISQTAQEEAKMIISRVFWMFNRWVRGYCSIILLEGLLYLIFFHFFKVPFATPLALIASLTILLPFLGPTISFLLSAGVVLLFAEHVGFPLIGVIIAYTFINGFLEQIFLYPILVGEAIGLTTLETIIVALFGGVVAGIPGMIFAVPVAALCKFLLPLAWKVFNPFARKKTEEQNQTKALPQ